MGGGQAEGAVSAVLELEEGVAKGGGSARGFPQFQGLNNGHFDFLTTGGVHLFTDDVFDVAEDSPCEGHVAVDAGGDLVDHAGLEHEAVTYGLGLCGLASKSLTEHSGSRMDGS